MAEKVDSETILQKDYLQKSKVFLLPLAGIKRDRTFEPSNTYISSEDLLSDEYPNGIKMDSSILIVAFSKTLRQNSENLLLRIKDQKLVEEHEKSRWDSYEEISLFSNKRFIAFHETYEDLVYTFDMVDWSKEWKKFIHGRYSLFSDKAKDIILKYKNLKPMDHKKLMSYLYPNKEEYLKEYAKDLELTVEELKEVKELCNAPDLSKETYKFEVKMQ